MALGMEALSTVPGTLYVTPHPHLLSLSLTLPSVSVSGAANPQTELPRLPRPGASWWALPAGGPKTGEVGEALVLLGSLTLFLTLPVGSERQAAPAAALSPSPSSWG